MMNHLRKVLTIPAFSSCEKFSPCRYLFQHYDCRLDTVDVNYFNWRKCFVRHSSDYMSKINPNAFSAYARFLLNISDELLNLKTTNAAKSLKWPPLLFDELGGSNNAVTEKLRSVVSIAQQLEVKEEEYNDIASLAAESSADQIFLTEVKAEVLKVEEEINGLKCMIIDEIVVDKELDECEGAILEVRAGVGGEEAMLFAMELYEMYSNFCNIHGMEMKEVDHETGNESGLLKASCIITSDDGFAYSLLRHEAGVHRVQRVPKTESRGRIHTSTASVAVMPKHDTSGFKVDPKDIKTYFTYSPGSGGQHVNKTMSCALVRHIPTGIQVRCHATRVQVENLNRAMQQLTQILHKRFLDENQSRLNAVRTGQTRSRERSDKIRTYNYHHNRITDHRIGYTMHGIESFLSGGSAFESLLKELDNKCRNDDKVAIMNALIKEANLT